MFGRLMRFRCELQRPHVLPRATGDALRLEPGTELAGWVSLVHAEKGGLALEAYFLAGDEVFAFIDTLTAEVLRPRAMDTLALESGFTRSDSARGPIDTLDALEPWPEALLPRALVPSPVTEFSYMVELTETHLTVALLLRPRQLHFRRSLEDLLFRPGAAGGPPAPALLARIAGTADVPLMRAAFSGYRGHAFDEATLRALMYQPIQADRDDVLALSLELGMDPNLRLGGGTPLHMAASWDRPAIIKRLITAGADPNALDSNGDSPLHRAAKADKPAAYEALLAGGARDDLADAKTGLTPARMRTLRAFHAAVTRGDVDAVTAMLAGLPRPEAQALVDEPLGGSTALLVAAKTGQEAVLEKIAPLTGEINRLLGLDGTKWPALHCAVAHRHFGAAAVLLAHGADPGVRTPEWTAGGAVMKGGKTALHLAAQACSRPLARLLLEHGAAIDDADGYGETPLSYAARHHYAHKLVQLLLEHGADPAVRDRDKFTALERATKDRHARVAQVLAGR